MRRVTAIRPPRWQAVAAAAGAALLAAACGSSGTPSSGSSPSTTSAPPSSAAPSPASAVCQDAAALRASIDTLTHLQVGQGMGDEIKSDLADVRAKLNTLTTQAHGQWQSQTPQLEELLLAYLRSPEAPPLISPVARIPGRSSGPRGAAA